MSVTHSLTVSLQPASGFRVNVSDPEWVTGKLKAPLESVSAVMTGVVDAETVTPGSLAPAPFCTVSFTAAVYVYCLRVRMGGVNNVQGEIAEDLFRRNIKGALKEFDMDMDEVYHNLKAPGVGEYDVAAVNGSEAVVVEIKNKLKANDIRKFYEIQLPRFKTAFPQFTNYKVYGGLGALVMSNEQETEIAAMGLFVLTQGHDGIARVKKPKIPIIL